MGYTADPTAIIDAGAEIGDGTRIWHWVHVSGGARIGRECSLGQNVFIGNRVVIGANCKIQNNVSVYDNVTLEDDVFCGPSVVFTNVLNPRSHVPRKSEYRDTLVKRGATLGANCTIICGVTLGCYAFVGAGAVITRNVPDYALFMGNPARLRGWMCACGVKVATERSAAGAVVCAACSASYEFDGRQLQPSDMTSRSPRR